ncbi:hypothetical protein GBO14_18230 [Pseudoalteromonas shioyasakiensis]|uniref:hypothetical protein n=1 Tax=Pseudoalteromonas shioyasakiensis TaxID=1190813 RepID=UPI0020943C92|nr:hypothetical protein [Pseudoalteromonas shioyasakiensis]MCO6356661.1 hypothetical protein [Pseudoalteromonas shioyasakiensis]
MKRFNKIALIPAAIAAGLASNAYAGSQACFEVYKVADDAAVTAHSTLFGAASCPTTRTGASATNLEPFDVTSIAYELTGDLDFTLDDVNTANEDMHMVYIPTTDIPSGTIIEIDLGGATWTSNGNQMHLVRQDATTGNYGIVASSDGTLDGQSKATFLTKAGITIGAGSRLAFTTNNAVDGTNDPSLIVSPTINIKQTGCSPSANSITIEATRAQTDGGQGYNIAGGVSASADKLVDISNQFYLLEDFANTPTATPFSNGSASSGQVTVEVDAEGTSSITARTRFIDEGASDFITDIEAGTSNPTLASGAVFPFRMIDRGPSLDQAITLGAADKVKFDLEVSGSTTDVGSVLFSLRDGWSGDDVAPTTILDRNNAVDSWKPATTTTMAHSYDATALFADFANEGAHYTNDLANINDNAVYAYLENNADGVMNFNYELSIDDAMLDFSNGDYIDSCLVDSKTHKVTVNGAVLKVPYTYETKNNWIRITNEHTAEASITVDIFDESSNQINSVSLGKVADHASVVLLASDILATAKAAGYAGVGNRHTMTFTVTAPKDSVHGVSVQKIPGGVDRVMPVLDQNNWDQ